MCVISVCVIHTFMCVCVVHTFICVCVCVCMCVICVCVTHTCVTGGMDTAHWCVLGLVRICMRTIRLVCVGLVRVHMCEITLVLVWSSKCLYVYMSHTHTWGGDMWYGCGTLQASVCEYTYTHTHTHTHITVF